MLLAVAAAWADVGPDDKWIVQLRASDPAGGHAVLLMGSFGTGDVSGLPFSKDFDFGENAGVYCCIRRIGDDEYPERWYKDIRAPMAAGATNTWHLIVEAGSSYGFSQIKLAGWNQSGSVYDLNGSIPVKLVVVSDPSWPAEGSCAAGELLWEPTLDPNVNGTSLAPTYTRMLNWTGQQIRLDLVAGETGGGSPTVTDDGDYSSGTASLHASWSPPGAVEYQYAVGESQQNLAVGWKSAGTATQASETGLSLQTGRTYYWFVKARLGDSSWSGVGSSDGIIAAAARSVGEARTGPPGEAVYLADTVVASTNSDPAGLWVQSADAASAIKIGASWTTVRGDRIDAAGLVNWIDGMPVLSAPELKRRVPGASTEPRFLRNADLASDRTGSLVYQGVNPVGVLAAAFGEVTAVDASANAFYVDDGSYLQDGMGPSGAQYVGLRVAYKPGVTAPSVGSRVRVTGIRTVLKVTLDHDSYVNGTWRSAGETIYVPVLATRDAEDILPVEM